MIVSQCYACYEPLESHEIYSIDNRDYCKDCATDPDITGICPDCGNELAPKYEHNKISGFDSCNCKI